MSEAIPTWRHTAHLDGSTTAWPLMPGHGQLRRAFLGWQFRVSVKGEVFSPWMFTFTRRRALTKLGWFNLKLVEEET
jgi:hypothetical protein